MYRVVKLVSFFRFAVDCAWYMIQTNFSAQVRTTLGENWVKALYVPYIWSIISLQQIFWIIFIVRSPLKHSTGTFM